MEEFARKTGAILVANAIIQTEFGMLTTRYVFSTVTEDAENRNPQKV